MELATLNKIREILEKLDELTSDLFYTIPLDYKGKEYNGRALRQQINFIDRHIQEIAREFNIKLG